MNMKKHQNIYFFILFQYVAIDLLVFYWFN